MNTYKYKFYLRLFFRCNKVVTQVSVLVKSTTLLSCFDCDSEDEEENSTEKRRGSPDMVTQNWFTKLEPNQTVPSLPCWPTTLFFCLFSRLRDQQVVHSRRPAGLVSIFNAAEEQRKYRVFIMVVVERHHLQNGVGATGTKTMDIHFISFKNFSESIRVATVL